MTLPYSVNDGFSEPNLLGPSHGVIAQWNGEKGWHDRDGGLPLPSPMIVMGVNTELRRWKDNKNGKNKKLETIDDKPLPNVDLLNSTIPQSEWELGLDGKLQPPWKFTYVIYLYDPVTGTTYNFANSTVANRQIQGIRSVESRPHFARVMSEHGIGFARGSLVNVELDEEEFAGSGVFVFASVLERFLGMYASLNSFSQLAVRTLQRKEVPKQWPPRAGRKILM